MANDSEKKRTTEALGDEGRAAWTPGESEAVVEELRKLNFELAGSSSPLEPDSLGPWEVYRGPEGHHRVYREGEHPGGEEAAGEARVGIMHRRQDAFALASAFDSIESKGRFQPFSEPGPEDSGVAPVWTEDGTELLGHLSRHDPEILKRFHMARVVARSPLALSYLLEKAGPDVVRESMEILRRQLEEQEQ